MKLDFVHDIQTAYRKVIDAMSRPGTVAELHEEADKVELETDCYSSTVVLALMLLDTEVTFNVISVHQKEVTRRINQLTYAKPANIESADFIFVLQDAEDAQLGQALQAAKTGTLMNPHESATVIIEAEKLTGGDRLLLQGPGIEAEQEAQIAGAGKWIHIREEKNVEYPLGIDILVTDDTGSVICLPRTTQARKEVTA